MSRLPGGEGVVRILASAGGVLEWSGILYKEDAVIWRYAAGSSSRCGRPRVSLSSALDMSMLFRCKILRYSSRA